MPYFQSFEEKQNEKYSFNTFVNMGSTFITTSGVRNFKLQEITSENCPRTSETPMGSSESK